MAHRSKLNIMLIKDMINNDFPVGKGATPEMPLKQRVQKNLEALQTIVDAPGDIPLEILLHQLINRIPAYERLAEQKRQYRVQAALILSTHNPHDLMGWAQANAVYPPYAKKGLFLSELVTANLAKNSHLVRKHLGTAIEVTQGNLFFKNKSQQKKIEQVEPAVDVELEKKNPFQPATVKLIDTVTRIRPKSSLLYARKIKNNLGVEPVKAEIFASVLKKKPHMLTPDEKLDVARHYTIRAKMHLNGKNTFRKRQDTDVLEALQNSPVDERLQIISLLRSTDAMPQDHMINASVMVSLFAENKGMQTYRTLLPAARKLLVQWPESNHEDQQAVKGQLKFFVGDPKDRAGGNQLKLEF